MKRSQAHAIFTEAARRIAEGESSYPGSAIARAVGNANWAHSWNLYYFLFVEYVDDFKDQCCSGFSIQSLLFAAEIARSEGL